MPGSHHFWHRSCRTFVWVGGRMNAELVLAPNSRLELQPSPLLLGFVELLALPAQGLEQRIEREVADNPALELIDTHECRACGLNWSSCTNCGGSQPAQRQASGAHGVERTDGVIDTLAGATTAAQRLLNEAL